MPKDPTLVGNRYNKSFCKCGHTKQDHASRGFKRFEKSTTSCEWPYCDCSGYKFWKKDEE